MSDDTSEVNTKPLNGIIGKLDFDWIVYINYLSTNMEENQNLKIILIGNSNAGKTSLIIKFKTDRFSCDSVNTVGVDLNVEKNVKINNQLYDIAIWDTAG